MDVTERGKAAAAKHDRFNLFAIPPLVALTALSLAQGSKQLQAMLSWSVLGYIVVDFGWNALVPHCQPTLVRLATILVHHAITAWLVMHPIAHPENVQFTAYCTIVEVNTVFAVTRKVLKWRWLNTGFFVSWGTLRLLWYPYLVYHFHKVIRGQGHPRNSLVYYQTVGSQFLLSSLNYFWTGELLLSLLKPKKRKDKVKDKDKDKDKDK